MTPIGLTRAERIGCASKHIGGSSRRWGVPCRMRPPHLPVALAESRGLASVGQRIDSKPVHSSAQSNRTSPTHSP
jgi:hypothetical protein